MAHYPFDGAFDDVSGNAYSPTVSEVTFKTDRFGQEERSAFFSGQESSFMEVEGLLNDYSLATVSIWASWSGEIVGRSEQQIFNKPREEDGTGTGFGLKIHT